MLSQKTIDKEKQRQHTHNKPKQKKCLALLPELSFFFLCCRASFCFFTQVHVALRAHHFSTQTEETALSVQDMTETCTFQKQLC